MKDFTSLYGKQCVNMLSAGYSFGFYPSAGILDRLTAKRIKAIRLHTTWERLQPVLNAALVSAEVTRILACLDLCQARGIRAIVAPMNTGGLFDPAFGSDDGGGPPNYVGAGFNHSGGNRGAVAHYILGDTHLTSAAFADFWSRLSTALKGHPAVIGYCLINEPANGDGSGPLGSAWRTCGQAAINAIRAVDTETPILAMGDYYGSAEAWSGYGGNDDLDFTDPADNLVYEAHCYFDNGSGNYTHSYDDEPSSAFLGVAQGPTRGAQLVAPFVEWCVENGRKGFIGEWGVPAYDDPRYVVQAENFLSYCRANNIVTCQHFYYEPQQEPSWLADYNLGSHLDGFNTSHAANPLMPIIQKYNRSGGRLRLGR